MPSSAPPPGRRGSAPRRGIGGLLGVLAVLAFLVLAVVVITRRQPGRIADAPATSPAIPGGQSYPAAPSPEPTPAPSEAPPATDGLAASPEPEPAGAAPAPGGKPSARRAGAPPVKGATQVAGDTAAARRPGINPPAGSAPRRFLLGTTSIESLKPVGREIAGFEPGGVGVKRAPEVNGRVELEMEPAQVRPGVDYTVRLYLANDGDKDIPVEEVRVSTVENGKTSTRTVPARTRTVKPKQRTLLSEVEGVWRESARSWAMDVVVTSSRKDVYRNRLRWE